MPHIKATFQSGGIIKRRTTKNYTHAWQVRWRRPTNEDGHAVNSDGTALCDPICGEQGFASSLELAVKAAGSVANRIRSLDGYKGSKYEVFEEVIVPVEIERTC